MGYSSRFLKGATVDLPLINTDVHQRVATLKDDASRSVMDYIHYSVVVNKDRRLAIVSACNINGELIPDKSIPRKGSFRNEPGIEPKDQIGESFYSTCGDTLDKGHLTKYEDVIWGDNKSIDEYVDMGRSTFFYSNCAPQHQKLNRGKWKSLELYILDNETDDNDIKVNVFTGPVLSDLDPLYHEKIDGKNIQLPMHFWKIVMYSKDAKLFALGFMMSHQELMEASGLIKPVPVTRAEATDTEEKIYFNDYKHSEPYQVKVEQIEELAGISLQADKPIIKPFQKERPLEVLVREINVRSLPNGRRVLSDFVYPNMITS